MIDSGHYTDPVTGALRSHPVGQHVGLAFDAKGRASLLYLDAGRLGLKMARVDGVAVFGPWDLPGLPGGRDIVISVQGDQVRGAYGAWQAVAEGDTRVETAFELLDVPAQGPQR